MSLIHTLRFIANHPLNREKKVEALGRFFRWQVSSRLLPGAIVHSWVNGSRIVVRHGDHGLTMNLYCGLQEFADMAYLLHVVNADDLFVDVGANAGSYTVLACAVRSARGRCFEPVPSTFARLMDNIRINDLSGRVEAFNVGISDRECELAFTSAEDCTNHVIANCEKSADTITVKAMRLDDALGGQIPAVLKIDVEGFETAVIEGAAATLSHASLNSVIMELNGSGSRYGYDEALILATMREHGFSTYSYEPFSRTLKDLGGRCGPSGNTLFIRNLAAAERRICSAPRLQMGKVWL